MFDNSKYVDRYMRLGIPAEDGIAVWCTSTRLSDLPIQATLYTCQHKVGEVEVSLPLPWNEVSIFPSYMVFGSEDEAQRASEKAQKETK